MKLEVHSGTIVSKTVTIANRCENCDADLTGECALKLHEFEDQVRRGTWDASAGKVEKFTAPSGRSTFIHLAWLCGECGASLAEGDVTFDDSVLPSTSPT